MAVSEEVNSIVVVRRQGSSLVCFFSSRRRHTIYWRDWSSDVCSSDLIGDEAVRARVHGETRRSLDCPYRAVGQRLVVGGDPSAERNDYRIALLAGADAARKIGRASCRERV